MTSKVNRGGSRKNHHYSLIDPFDVEIRKRIRWETLRILERTQVLVWHLPSRTLSRVEVRVKHGIVSHGLGYKRGYFPELVLGHTRWLFLSKRLSLIFLCIHYTSQQKWTRFSVSMNLIRGTAIYSAPNKLSNPTVQTQAQPRSSLSKVFGYSLKRYLGFVNLA